MNRHFNPKLFTILKSGLDKKQLSSDILSGIVVGIVALPLAIAFAVASGVSPEKGLITAIIAGFLISVFGGSRVQIGGPTGAFIVIVYGIVEQYGVNGLIISTIMAGIILVLFGILKLGTLLKYIPHPLVVGFTTAIAIVIFSTQIKDALGLNIEHVPSDFIGKWSLYFKNISSINPLALVITLLTIFITIFSGKVLKKIPGSFIAIILMTTLVAILKLPVNTIESFFGNIPNTVNFTLPVFSITDLSLYIKPALTIAMLGAIESLLSAVVSDGMIGGNHRSNTELIAQGIANIVVPFFGGIPATGAIARTATNVKNGGRTPIAGVTHSIVLLFIMLFLGQWAKLIPMPCLAGILIVVSYNMSEWRTFLTILKGSPFDSVVLLSTFILTVLVDLTVAIEVGIVLSSILFMRRMAGSWKILNNESESDEIDNYKDLPKGVTVYEISGPLFFATIKEYLEVINDSGFDSKILILRMRHVPFVDATGIHNLKDAIKTLNKSGTSTFLTDVNPHVKKQIGNNVIEDKFIYSKFSDAIKQITDNKL